MNKYIIPNKISKKILMIGVYYKKNAPGGMASVVQYYEHYFENLKYISSWKLTHKLGRLYFAIFAYFKLLFLLIFDKNIKIVHIHTAADASFWRKSIFLSLSKGFNKKVLLHIHASRFKDFYYESSKKAKIKHTLNKANKVIVLSQSWREWFIKIGIPSENVLVLNNITAKPDKQINKTKNNKINLLFLGEIGERKGVFDLLKSLSNNKDYFKSKIFLKIGGNKNEDKIKSTIISQGLEDFVFFEGWVSGRKKQELLNWAHIFILPSYNEGLPIAILEAMSYGCVIISSNVGGIPEVVFSKKNGIIVQPGNINQISEAILYYTNNQDKISEGSLESLEIVKPFLPDIVLNDLKNIYIDIL